jgi:urease accessory protein UreE
MSITEIITSIDPENGQFAVLRWADLNRIVAMLTTEQQASLGILPVELFIRDGDDLLHIDPLAEIRKSMRV